MPPARIGLCLALALGLAAAGFAAAPPVGPAAPAPPASPRAAAPEAKTPFPAPGGSAAPRRTGGVLPADLLALDSVRLAVMEPNGVFPGDLDLLPPGGRRDRFRLSRVETVLANPFSLEGVVDEVLARTDPHAVEDRPLPVPPDHLWPLLDVEPGTWPGQLPGLPGPPDSALGLIRAGLDGHLAGFAPAERAFLFREASSLFLEEEEDTSLAPVPMELKRLEEDARAHRILELAGRLDRASLVRAASAAWGLQAWILDSLRGPEPERFLARLERLAARAKVPLKVGGRGADRHRPDHGIWIDLGGDDQWELSPRGRPGDFLMVVDVAGNDTWRSRDSLHRSPGNLGVSLIADLAGDDHYLGENYAFGSALFGYSHLFDAAGHDYYEGRCASLGFAAFGIGVLQDEAGNDTYSASLLSQGASSTWGLGLLLDRGGDDRYLARPTFKDDLRYQDRYIHMVQGFSTGLAPDYSGGIGILRDQGGNDAYLADIFGQGSGYWYAMGLLLDESGNDRYQAHQYAQGAGVHIAVGAAVDWAGDDHWASKGVSQGCGHDLAFGLLHDRAGDDAYLGTDKVQGSGSANGLGVLYDAAGDDAYTTLNPEMGVGDADMRRDRGSFGFFLDGRGKDRYTQRKDKAIRGDGGAWRVFDGKAKGNGYGLDLDDSASGPATAPVAADAVPARSDTDVTPRPLEAAAAVPPPESTAQSRGHASTHRGGGPAHFPVFAFAPPALSAMDTLFIVAATGEPRFQSLRDSAQKRLVDAGAATLDFLIARRLTGQTPRQRHYVEGLFILASDSGRRREPTLRLEAALAKAPDSVKVQLLRIGSVLGDSAFLPVARKYLRADSADVRRMALRSLGAYTRAADRSFLLQDIGKTSGLERQMRLWALAQHPAVPEWASLLPLLGDEKQYNRQWVRQIVGKAAGGDWRKVAKHAPARPELEWLLLAQEMPGAASAAWIDRMLPSLDPAQRRFFRGARAKSPR